MPRSIRGTLNSTVWRTVTTARSTTSPAGSPAQACDSSVTPVLPQAVTALKAAAPSPPTLAYTFLNVGLNALTYTVEETDENGTTQDYPWLSLDKSGAAVASGSNDAVLASVMDTNLPHGTHTAYITFTHSCSPLKKHTRCIDLAITDCAASVAPGSEAARSVGAGSSGPVSDAVFTLTNTGTDGLTYSVTKEGDCGWLVLLVRARSGPWLRGRAAICMRSLIRRAFRSAYIPARFVSRIPSLAAPIRSRTFSGR